MKTVLIIEDLEADRYLDRTVIENSEIENSEIEATLHFARNSRKDQ